MAAERGGDGIAHLGAMTPRTHGPPPQQGRGRPCGSSLSGRSGRFAAVGQMRDPSVPAGSDVVVAAQTQRTELDRVGGRPGSAAPTAARRSRLGSVRPGWAVQRLRSVAAAAPPPWGYAGLASSHHPQCGQRARLRACHCRQRGHRMCIMAPRRVTQPAGLSLHSDHHKLHAGRWASGRTKPGERSVVVASKSEQV